MSSKKANKHSENVQAGKRSMPTRSTGDKVSREDDLFSEPFQRGTRLLHQRRAAESIPYLEQALQIEPENVDAAINLGGAYILTKQFQKAVELLEPFSLREPDLAQIWINLGAAYLGNPVLARKEEQKRAISAFENALAIDPAAPSVAYNIGLVYRDMGESEKAIEWFCKAIKDNPADKDARRLLNKLENDAPNK